MPRTCARTARRKAPASKRAKTPASPAAVAVVEPPPVLEERGFPRIEEWVQTPCPYCGEGLEVLVSSDEDGQTRSEECSVCCRMASLHITWEDGEPRVEVGR